MKKEALLKSATNLLLGSACKKQRNKTGSVEGQMLATITRSLLPRMSGLSARYFEHPRADVADGQRRGGIDKKGPFLDSFVSANLV